MESSQRSLYITGSRLPRPEAQRVIFCDGGVDASYREGLDLELSHWIPNATPAQYKADTSTEICLRFVAVHPDGEDLVINNHVDVDGALSTFVLLHPQLAYEHRHTLVQAAEVGDFGGWGSLDALHLYQSLVCLIPQLQARELDPLDIYIRCYGRVHACLRGERFAECEAGLAALQRSVARIEDGSIARTLLGERLVHYAISRPLAAANLEAALFIPDFNEPLSTTALLLPNARAKLDSQRAQLVSVEIPAGTYYDLWYPGYVWADTVSLWRAPGVRHQGTSNRHVLEHAQLQSAVAELNRLETAEGTWSLATTLSPFASLAGRGFPVVLSFMRSARPAPSGLPADVVTQLLGSIYE